MTRVECETRIAEHMEAIIDIAKQYSPDTKYFTACYCADKGREAYYFQNEHFVKGSPDENHPIDFFKSIKRKWNNVHTAFDYASNSYTVIIDGKVEFEHLAQDEFSEVMRNLMP